MPMMGLGFGINKGTSGAYSAPPGPNGNMLSGQEWIAGADTNLIRQGDRAVAVATSTNDPYIYKILNGLIQGHTYRVTGMVYPGPSGDLILNVTDDITLVSPGVVYETYPASTPTAVDVTFVATLTEFYIGITQTGVTTPGESGGVSWELTVRDEGFTFNEVFIDSALGDDLNDGSEANPWQTLSRLPSLSNGMIVNLARGGYWREEIRFPLRDGVTIQAYGTGVLPVLDASDVDDNTGWVPEAGPNDDVYLKNLPFDGESAGELASIWEDGVRLLWVEDIPTCQATPGSWTGTIYTVGTTTYDYYIHPFGSTNPNSDGKEYTWAARQFGIRAGTNSRINNIRTRKQRGNSGSLHLGHYSVATGCIAEDGPYNNAKGESFTQFIDCVFYKSDYCNRENWLGLRFHESVPLAGATGIARRCIAMSSEAARDTSIGTPWTQYGIWTYNDSADPLENWASTLYEDCISEWNRVGFQIQATNSGSILRAHVKESANAIVSNTTQATITDLWVEDTTETVEGFQGAIAIIDGNVDIDGLRVAVDSCQFGLVYNETLDFGTINISNSVLYELPGDTGMYPIVRSPGDKVVSISQCILNPNITTGTSIVEVKVPTDVWFNTLVTGTDNSYWRIHENDNLSFADLQASEPLLTTSMEYTAVEQLTDPANGDFTLIDPVASQAAIMGAGCIRFPLYAPIPTEAELDAL